MNRRFVRRNRVDERLALAIASGSGLAAATAGASPTGSTAVDVVMVALAVTAVVWAAASAQWWALAGAAGISAVVAMHPIVAALGGLAFLAGLNVGTWRRDQTAARTVIAGVAINVLLRSQLEVFFGLSALVGISVALALLILGIQRRPSGIRRIAMLTAGGLGCIVTISLFAVLAASSAARPDVSTATKSARQAINRVNDGEYERAAQLFDDASVRFERADSRLGGPLAAPGRLVPVVAQNITSGADLSEAAASATAEAASALRQIDPTSLRLQDGRIDLDAVRAVEAPLQRVHVALSELRAVVEDAESPWLIGAVQDELARIDDEFSSNEPRLRNAIDAVRLAPQFFGADGPRRYLMLFSTPSEVRGLGGFVGNYAVIEVDDGVVTVSEFDRAETLNRLTTGADCSACPEELLQRYGPFGFMSGADGTVGNRLYSNVTMPAHFPYIAESVSLLYPQATGEIIDGVIIADPYVVQALMRYVGPVAVPELDTIVQPDDAAEFIVFDQYVLADTKAVRVEALETLASGVINALLRSDLPEPPKIARDLGPLIAERRLLMWTTDPAEQSLLDRVGMLGSIPALDPVDGGFSVSVSNGNANKIDVFLERTTDVRIETTPEGRQLVADVTFTNNAPTTGLPDYVIGNVVGLPDGYSRLFVTFYGPPTLIDVTLDGETYPVGALPEAGWVGYSNFVDLAPGQQRVFHLRFDLPPSAGNSGGGAGPTLWTQPLAERP